MRKKYRCEVDCASCAAKLEEAIRHLDGVEEAHVNFLTQKLTVEAADDSFAAVMENVLKTAKKVEPDAVITL